MKPHKYSLEQLKQAVNDAKSVRQVLIKLNVVPYGGNYETLKTATLLLLHVEVKTVPKLSSGLPSALPERFPRI